MCSTVEIRIIVYVFLKPSKQYFLKLNVYMDSKGILLQSWAGFHQTPRNADVLECILNSQALEGMPISWVMRQSDRICSSSFLTFIAIRGDTSYFAIINISYMQFFPVPFGAFTPISHVRQGDSQVFFPSVFLWLTLVFETFEHPSRKSFKLLDKIQFLSLQEQPRIKSTHYDSFAFWIIPFVTYCDYRAYYYYYLLNIKYFPSTWYNPLFACSKWSLSVFYRLNFVFSEYTCRSPRP